MCKEQEPKGEEENEEVGMGHGVPVVNGASGLVKPHSERGCLLPASLPLDVAPLHAGQHLISDTVNQGGDKSIKGCSKCGFGTCDPIAAPTNKLGMIRIEGVGRGVTHLMLLIVILRLFSRPSVTSDRIDPGPYSHDGCEVPSLQHPLFASPRPAVH